MHKQTFRLAWKNIDQVTKFRQNLYDTIYILTVEYMTSHN
jgi:hypothetical protein